MSPRPVSVTTGSFFPERTFEAVERIQRLGFSSLEVTIQEPDVNYGFFRSFDKGFYHDLHRRVRELELLAEVVHAPYFSGAQVFSRKVRSDILSGTLEVARLLESEVLVVHPYHVFTSYEEGLISGRQTQSRKSLLPDFKLLLLGAEESAIIIAIENVAHWNDSPFLNNPDNMFALVEGLNSECVKVDLGLFHSEMGKCTNPFLRKLKHVIVSVHVSDLSDSRSRTLPGKGKLDWNGTCRRLKELPHLQHVVMEMTGKHGDEEIRQSANYLNRLLVAEA